MMNPALSWTTQPCCLGICVVTVAVILGFTVTLQHEASLANIEWYLEIGFFEGSICFFRLDMAVMAVVFWVFGLLDTLKISICALHTPILDIVSITS